tara:strand:+ start:1303 stop:1542 length:240 start_codon:yes stop_codon:yes gene_type:complete
MSNKKSKVEPPKSLKKALSEVGDPIFERNKKIETLIPPKGLVGQFKSTQRAAKSTLTEMKEKYPKLMKKVFYRKAQSID